MNYNHHYSIIPIPGLQLIVLHPIVRWTDAQGPMRVVALTLQKIKNWCQEKKKKNYWCLQGDQSPQQYIRVTGSPKVGQNPGKLFISVKKEIIWRDVGNRVTIYDSAIFLYKVFQ